METNTSFQTPNERTQLTFGDFVLPLSALLVAITEWSSWTVDSSYLRSIWSMTPITSYIVALVLLFLSLLALLSEGFKTLFQKLAFAAFSSTRIIFWPNSRKTVVELIIPILLLMLVVNKVLTTVPIVAKDLSLTISNVTSVYLLCVVIIFLLQFRIPKTEKPTISGNGIIHYDIDGYYGLIDTSEKLIYVFNNQTSNWEKASSLTLLKGEKAVLFDPLKILSLVESLKIENPNFGVELSVRVVPVVNSFPTVISSHAISKFEQLFLASSEERKTILEIAAAKLSSLFENDIKKFFGITESGQFIFDNITRILKKNALISWEETLKIDCESLATQLENTFSVSWIGKGQVPSQSPIVCSVDVSIIKSWLSDKFKTLDDSLRRFAEVNQETGTDLRAKIIEEAATAFIALCPIGSNPKEISEFFKNVFTDQQSTQPIIETITQKSIDEEGINIQGRITGNIQIDDEVFDKADALTQFSTWVKKQQTNQDSKSQEKVISDTYFRLLDLELIDHLRPGISSKAMAMEIEKAMHVSIDQLTDPNSKLNMDYNYRLGIAKKLVR